MISFRIAQRNPVEMICRGKIPLQGARISATGPCTFDISDYGVQTFHIKACNEAECETWLKALQMAKANPM